MGSYWYVFYLILFVLLLIYLGKRKRRRIFARKFVINKNRLKERMIMHELAKRFIGKDCLINLLEGTTYGVISEVTEGGIVLIDKGKEQIVNLDYVLKIREYPYKNGKRATFVGD